MPQAQIAASHYEPDGIGDDRKFVVNCYAEASQSDPQRPFKLTNTPGSLLYSTGLTGSCRGVFYQEGFNPNLLVVDGTTVRRINTNLNNTTNMTGTLSGTDRVQAVFSEAEGAFLSGGDIYTATKAGVVAAVTDADYATLLSDHNQIAFSSIATMGQRLLFTYGSRFGYSAAGDFDDTTTISFYTAERNPDPLVCGVVLGRTYWLFGTQTIEPWVETGNNDDPFSPIQVDPVFRGCLARDTVVQVDNTLLWIGDDRGVYRLNGVTPVRLDTKDAWVNRHLETVDASDIICSKVETEGHAFYCINTPTRCIVFDIATNMWHLRQTYNTDGWEWAFQVRAGDKHFAGSRTGSRFAELNRDYKYDRLATAGGTGEPIVRKMSAHLPVLSQRSAIENVRLDGVSGVGLTTGQGSDPLVTMEISTDRGNTFGVPRSRSLGRIGEYDKKPYWTRCGRVRPGQTVMRFTMSDPVNFGQTGVAVNEGQ